ncbi:CAP domain-containing protein [Streptomyces glaucescens]|uniref:Transmembrane protein n=1 Tax=Streptomyces glaucescens TaxID=1907 RepID=A0A089XBX4_STRGA|nr:CAP domain-containing protein [Streptomyces glaucescens]AIS00759.1 transmembrane protein [Streptomyces glaucescens]
MGRHRRSAAGRAATGRATGVTPGRSAGGSADQGHTPGHRHPEPGIAPYLNPEAYAEVRARSEAYLFATDDDPAAGQDSPADTVVLPATGASPASGEAPRGRSHRRRKKAVTPVRTGLLGVSAAVAIGAVAVAAGVLPGGGDYTLGGGSGNQVQATDGAGGTTEGPLGGTSGSAETETGDGTAPGRSATRPTSPSAAPSTPSASPTTEKPSAVPSRKPSATPSERQPEPTPTPSRTATAEPPRTTAPVTVSEAAAVEAEVLQLVNEERARAGCRPVAANSALAKLARDFSEDMAARGFFDHTDPDGATPWDRAEKAGISNLGGENIARGQADAATVMAAWMDSPGHRANILNCEFTTLGVGVHFGPGGPWWTQDFGY